MAQQSFTIQILDETGEVVWSQSVLVSSDVRVDFPETSS